MLLKLCFLDSGLLCNYFWSAACDRSVRKRNTSSHYRYGFFFLRGAIYYVCHPLFIGLCRSHSLCSNRIDQRVSFFVHYCEPLCIFPATTFLIICFLTYQKKKNRIDQRVHPIELWWDLLDELILHPGKLCLHIGR